jgi:hypothetical protein
VDLRLPQQAVELESGQGDQRQEGEAMKSPCVDVCIMDPESALCQGCRRTLDEIARWSRMTEREREEVLASLPARKQDGKPESDIPEVPVPPFP